MSYVVSIVRESPVGESELEEVASDAGVYEIERSDGLLILHWCDTEENERESFVLSDGSLDITSPSDAALVAAQDLAARLGAKVVGEEGEDLTEVQITATAPASAGCGPVAGTITIVAVLLVAYWLFT